MHSSETPLAKNKSKQHTHGERGGTQGRNKQLDMWDVIKVHLFPETQWESVVCV